MKSSQQDLSGETAKSKQGLEALEAGELEEETRRRITARGEGCAGQCPEEMARRTWEKLLRIPRIWYDYPSIWHERKQMKIIWNFLDE